MHLQVGVLDVQWQVQALALNGARQGRRDVEIECVAELILPRGAAGFDAGGHIARVVSPKAGFSERAEQVTQSLEAEEVEARSEEHTSELQSRRDLVCRLL